MLARLRGTGKHLALKSYHCLCSQARGGCAARCNAGMGIGFRDEAEEQMRPELLLAESGIRVPKAAYGLSLGQMAALGLAGGEMALKMGEPSPVRRACGCVKQDACLMCITCEAHYVGVPTAALVTRVACACATLKRNAPCRF